MPNKIIIFSIAITMVLLSAGCIIMTLHIKSNNCMVSRVNVDSNSSYYAERITSNADLGGRHLTTNVTVKHYDRHGKAIGKRIHLSNLLKGRNAVLFLTRNNCFSCAEKEMLAFNTLRNKTGLSDNIFIIFNYPVHIKTTLAIKCGKGGYYEVDGGDLGTGVGEETEYPVLFSCEDGRIISGYCAESALQPYIHYFHEYLIRFLTKSDH